MRRDEGSRIGTRSRSGFERRGAERAARELARKRERDRRRAERQARMIARKAAAKVRTDRGMASRAVRTKVKDPEALLSPMARNLRAKFRDLETLRLAVIAGEVFGRPRCERPHAGGIGS